MKDKAVVIHQQEEIGSKQNFDYPSTLADFNLNVLFKLNALLKIDIEVVPAGDLNPKGHGNDLRKGD